MYQGKGSLCRYLYGTDNTGTLLVGPKAKLSSNGGDEDINYLWNGNRRLFRWFLELCSKLMVKRWEPNYCTPYLGYPYYSSHDELIHNFYHNDDCMPMRGFRWHIQDPICFDEDLKVTIQQIGVGYRGFISET